MLLGGVFRSIGAGDGPTGRDLDADVTMVGRAATDSVRVWNAVAGLWSWVPDSVAWSW